jgi:hypothetical protein
MRWIKIGLVALIVGIVWLPLVPAAIFIFAAILFVVAGIVGYRKAKRWLKIGLAALLAMILAVAAILAAPFIVLFIGVGILYDATLSPAPLDADLIRQFNTQQNDFKTLVTMMRADSSMANLQMVYLNYDFEGRINWQSPPRVDDNRLKQYRQLLGRIHALSIGIYPSVEIGRWDEIRITQWAVGLLDNGTLKGYAYFPSGFPPELADKIVSDVDDQPGRFEQDTTLYRRINDHWYLWITYGD